MKIQKILGIGVIAATIVACTTNPITGRKSFQFMSDNQLAAMAMTEYKTTLSKAKVVSGTSEAKRVQNVGLRIKNAAENYYRAIGKEQALSSYQWEFNLLEDKQINAWCMPGGKVAFYTGIMPVCKDETGVAVVMGHEVSHALAGHGNERISSAMIAQYGGAIAGSAIKNAQLGSIFRSAYPVGAQMGLLAYGRKQELEADQMGLYLMAMAGYDPREAQPFWHRMEAMSAVGKDGNARPPEFLSTHPSPDHRRQDMDKHIPKALEYYQAAGGKL